MITRPLLLASLLLVVVSGCSRQSAPNAVRALDNTRDWGIYRGDQRGNQFSELDQINASNVSQLEPAWVYKTGDASSGSAMQCNPIIVEGIMFMVTPAGRVLALDAATGAEVWEFDPRTPEQKERRASIVNRGVTYWADGDDRRIFFSRENWMYAINADTGDLVSAFGDRGKLDLRQDMGMPPEEVTLNMTSPAAVFEDYLILGTRVNEGFGSSPGHIRAYDARTGNFKWIFHTIPQEGQFGYDTWEWVEGETYGGANPWGGLTIDEKRGWVFAATGSPTYDFYGANRKGQNLFGNCVLALDARTGKRQWHYQTVHHDIWDMDNPPAPILIDLKVDGKPREAVVQMTKMGYLFVLDRDTGEPIFPVEERPVAASTVPGEEAWPTQPFPLKPPPLVRQGFDKETDLSDISPEALESVTKAVETYSGGPIFTPPSTEGHILMPGMSGGMEWHGASYDASTGMLYVNVNESSHLMRLHATTTLVDDSGLSNYERGQLLYQLNCSVCHGLELKGNPPLIPNLRETTKTDREILTTIQQGQGGMQPFKNFSEEDLRGVLAYIRNPSAALPDLSGRETKTVYLLEGYIKFQDHEGFPGNKPPWGSMAAVDLNDGTIKWKVPLGEYPELAKRGIRNTGSWNFGGAVATAGGIVFIGATADEKIRAFDQETGKVLWEYQLSYGGHATPAVYEVAGRQYVAICAGGGPKVGTPSGDAVYVFALPEE